MTSSLPSQVDSNADIRIVCFDLGGVLVRICRNWTEACAHAGLDVRGTSAAEELKQRRREIAVAYGIGAIDTNTFYDQISQSLNRLYSPEEIARIHHVWTMDEYPGVGEIIDALNNSGLITACLSNTNHGHWIRMVNLDDEGQSPRIGSEPEYPSVIRLKHHFASHLIGAVKPNPTIYEHFVREMNATNPAEILFFDDLEENIAAARAQGWRAEQIDFAGDTASQITGHLKRYHVLSQ